MEPGKRQTTKFNALFFWIAVLLNIAKVAAAPMPAKGQCYRVVVERSAWCRYAYVTCTNGLHYSKHQPLRHVCHGTLSHGTSYTNDNDPVCVVELPSNTQQVELPCYPPGGSSAGYNFTWYKSDDRYLEPVPVSNIYGPYTASYSKESCGRFSAISCQRRLDPSITAVSPQTTSSTLVQTTNPHDGTSQTPSPPAVTSQITSPQANPQTQGMLTLQPEPPPWQPPAAESKDASAATHVKMDSCGKVLRFTTANLKVSNFPDIVGAYTCEAQLNKNSKEKGPAIERRFLLVRSKNAYTGADIISNVCHPIPLSGTEFADSHSLPGTQIATIRSKRGQPLCLFVPEHHNRPVTWFQYDQQGRRTQVLHSMEQLSNNTASNGDWLTTIPGVSVHGMYRENLTIASLNDEFIGVLGVEIQQAVDEEKASVTDNSQSDAKPSRTFLFSVESEPDSQSSLDNLPYYVGIPVGISLIVAITIFIYTTRPRSNHPVPPNPNGARGANPVGDQSNLGDQPCTDHQTDAAALFGTGSACVDRSPMASAGSSTVGPATEETPLLSLTHQPTERRPGSTSPTNSDHSTTSSDMSSNNSGSSSENSPSLQRASTSPKTKDTTL